jgi:Methylamine utilisation protein MauE
MEKSKIINYIGYSFILLFLYTAVSKFLDIPHFRLALLYSPLLRALAPILAIGIPSIELIISMLLLSSKYQKLGFYASLVLMSLFTLYVGYMLATVPTKDLPCSCGGIIDKLSWKAHLVLNSILTVLALTAVILFKNRMNQSDVKIENARSYA